MMRLQVTIGTELPIARNQMVQNFRKRFTGKRVTSAKVSFQSWPMWGINPRFSL